MFINGSHLKMFPTAQHQTQTVPQYVVQRPLFLRTKICKKFTLKDGKNGKNERTGEEYKGIFSKCSVASNKSEI